MLRRLDRDDPVRHNAEEIQKAGERAAELTRQLLAFSRKQVMIPQVLDLGEVVAETESILRRLIGEDVELVTSKETQLGAVRADGSQVEQVVMNLAVNARDAMPKGGRLTITLRNVELDEAFVRDHPGAKPGPHVLLSVSDTGVGMSPETQSHLFEPFFTTKEVGKGTGLGLATVYGIVKQSEGYVSVRSELGRGSTFEVFLPRVEDTPRPTRVARAPRPSRGSETILLVEDEEAVRSLVEEILSSAGYRVLPAANGAEAVQISRDHDGPHPSPDDRRRDAGDERASAREPDSGDEAERADPLHLGLHGRRPGAARRAGAGTGLPPEAPRPGRPRGARSGAARRMAGGGGAARGYLRKNHKG